MGISGLLPLLKSIQRPIDLRRYAGETFAVDAYGWLHRGAISCAMELAQGRPTRKYIDSVLNRVRMVQHFGVTPYLVFDGDFLPSKAGTEASRAKRREESRQAGQELLNAGKSRQAFLEFQKAIDITPDMARLLIEELKKLGLPYVVAPYEADAQMVYLERQGLVSGILSEDSDLLVFGARRLLTKLDMQGRCIEINRREFCAVREISLTDWTDAEFRHMAILSGCDYLDGIGNIGLKTAYRLIRKHKTVDKVVRALQFDGKFKVSENYLAAFRQAELTFLHQRVFCPVKQQLVLLTEPTSGLDIDEMRFIGHKIDHDIAHAVALGDLHPMTKEPIVLPPSPGKKRRASSAAGTTALPLSPASFGKPIHEYFSKRRDAASRIPLGSMDPNCFAVDREQVAALTQNGLTPRVFPLPRPYVDGGRASLGAPLTNADSAPPRPSPVADSLRLRRRQTEPFASFLHLGRAQRSTSTAASQQMSTSMLPPPSRSASQPTSQSASQCASKSMSLSQHALQSTLSPRLARPLKKVRLSRDEPATAPASPPEKTLERSKYFSAAPTSMPAASSKRGGGLGEALLMSDDSVEEAMLSLPDLDEWDQTMSGKSTSALRVFEDAPASSDGVEVPASPSPTMARYQNTLAPLGSLESLESSQPSQPNEMTPASQLSLSRFAYGGAAHMVHGLPTPASSLVGSQDAETALSCMRSGLLADVPTPSSTASRLARRQPAKTTRMSLGELVEATSPERLDRDRTRSKRPNKDLARRSLGAAAPPVNPSFVPLPPADLVEVAALNRPLGSEDQIIPDSDGEDGEDNADADATAQPGSSPALGRLDLSRFLCR